MNEKVGIIAYFLKKQCLHYGIATIAHKNASTTMKNYKKIISVLCIIIVAMTAAMTIVIYQNGRDGTIAAKKEAEMVLRKTSEYVINNEYNKLGPSFYISKKGEERHTHRRLITKKGEFVIDIDSLKESQSLYPLEAIGRKLQILQAFNSFSFNTVLVAWKKGIETEYGGAKCALRFKETPLDGSGASEYCLGDSFICSSQYILDTYYVDHMYATTLTAYFAPSSFWQCVNWRAFDIVLMFCLWVLLLVGLLFVLFLKYIKNGANMEDKANITTMPVVIGKCTFDIVKRTLSCCGQEISCSPQISDLLYAFALAPDYFLSNSEIASVCGWDSTELSVDERRRKAISQMSIFLKKNVKLQVKSVSGKNGYQLCEYC